MSRLDTIREDLQQGQTLKFVSQAYTEISATKMRHIRSTFEDNRRFFDEIRKLYSALKRVAVKRGLPNLVEKKIQTQRLLAVAVTSNHRFVGDLNRLVLEQFIRDREHYTHYLVVGHSGIRYMQTHHVEMPVDTMTFDQDRPTSGEATQMMDYASDFDRVHIYHPRFKTIRTQDVGMRDITYSPKEKAGEIAFDYILEPELPAMLRFFETQVRRVLFERTMLETDLAWTAARLWEMSTAEERADDFVEKKRKELLHAVRSLRNMRLLESVTGILYEQ